MGFSRKKKNVPPPLLRISIFFEVEPPGFPVKFTVTPLEFSIFFAFDPPGNLCFTSILSVPPWNSNEFYPLEFSIDILNKGVKIMIG